MGDALEVAIVSAAALIALGVFVWPLIPRRRAAQPPVSSGPRCAACESEPIRTSPADGPVPSRR